jgi:hypothetical protein
MMSQSAVDIPIQIQRKLVRERELGALTAGKSRNASSAGAVPSAVMAGSSRDARSASARASTAGSRCDARSAASLVQCPKKAASPVAEFYHLKQQER